MTQNVFVASEWVRRLTEAIDWFVQYEKSWEEKMLNLHYAERNSLDWPIREYKDSTSERVDGYSYLYWFPKSAAFSPEYRKPLLSQLSEAVAVLREHPVISRALSDDEQEMDVYTAFNRRRVGIAYIVKGLVEYAIERSAPEAASLLEETIRLGEKRQLEGFHITLFHGLRVEEEFKLPNGILVTSFEKVQELIDLSFLKTVLLNRRFVGHSFSSMSAVVGRFQWGPTIVPVSDDPDRNWPAFREDFDVDTILVLDILPVVCGVPVTRFQCFHSCFDQRIAKVLGKGWYRPTLSEVEEELSFYKRNPGVPVLSGEAMSKVNEVFSSLTRLGKDHDQGVSTSHLTPHDLSTMYKRFNGYLLKSEPLPGLANFYLTMLESEFHRNRRKKAAQKYGIDYDVLHKVGDLAANRGGGLAARKADGSGTALTKRETDFLQEAARSMILRATDVAANPHGNHPKIKMADFP